MVCICNSKDPEDQYDLAHYGCPEEICPECYDTKSHKSRYCRECAAWFKMTEQEKNDRYR